MNEQTLLIINPASGTNDKKAVAEQATIGLAQSGFTLTVRFTEGPGDATRLAREASSMGFSTVVAAGGDGTINETARGLVDTPCTLGIIPCGSGNGFARHLGIPTDVAAAVDVIARRKIEVTDCGKVNGHLFFCTFGLGFDAAVSNRFAHAGHRGPLTYLRETIREYFSYHPEEYVITTEGREISRRAFIVAVCNAAQYGNNAYIAPGASVTDGKLDLTLVAKGSLIESAGMGVDLFTGMLAHNTLIQTIRTSHLTIDREHDGIAHIDGEPIMLDRHLDISCSGSALRVYVPESDPPFRPILTPLQAMGRDLKYTIRHIFPR